MWFGVRPVASFWCICDASWSCECCNWLRCMLIGCDAKSGDVKWRLGDITIYDACLRCFTIWFRKLLIESETRKTRKTLATIIKQFFRIHHRKGEDDGQNWGIFKHMFVKLVSLCFHSIVAGATCHF
jgi:hypothetical protein